MMRIADMHCDTVYLMINGQRNGVPEALCRNKLHIDLDKMEAANYQLQNFALFLHQGQITDPYVECKEQYALFRREIEKNSDRITQVRSYEEIMAAERAGKIAALLTIEEGEACHGEIEKLKEFYGLGVRMMTFTWNYDNSLSTSASKRDLGKPRNYAGSRPGLTETGLDFLAVMEELGMIPDVSHMSDEGIEDLLQNATKPFVASHSNARALCSHPRNLTDDFIRRMGEKGCVIGANYFSEFLTEGAGLSKVERIADHICYLINKGGIECVGLGSDFDGIGCELEMKDCAGMPMLAEALCRRGLKEAEMEKVFSGNVMRLYRELL